MEVSPLMLTGTGESSDMLMGGALSPQAAEARTSGPLVV
jgi:hypothetical protein